MLPHTAVIRTEKDYDFHRRLCGLYPLERNIILLSRSGINKIYLDLSEKEKEFFEAKVRKYIKKLKGIDIILQRNVKIPVPHVSIPSNLFTQAHYFNKPGDNFSTKKIITPVYNENQFPLSDPSSYRKAVTLIKKYIIENTGGVIAQKINKRISIPISLVVCRTRIHPNYLTVINMIVGLLSGVFLLMNTYFYIALGGFFFQLAAVMDGVDGEVAKFTLKVSKLGGWLDTLSDNLTLLLFLSAASYLYYLNSSGVLPLLFIALTFIGVGTMILAMVRYLRKYTDSGSLVTYDREFLQKLPQNDPLIMLTQKVKYFTKKEFFSILFFAIALTGKIHLLIPGIAIMLMASSIVLNLINAKYLKDFKQ